MLLGGTCKPRKGTGRLQQKQLLRACSSGSDSGCRGQMFTYSLKRRGPGSDRTENSWGSACTQKWNERFKIRRPSSEKLRNLSVEGGGTERGLAVSDCQHTNVHKWPLRVSQLRLVNSASISQTPWIPAPLRSGRQDRPPAR